ncbi:MAG: hypothetical protein U1A27_01605 [Phycisphaerae bacterium]
MILTRSPRRARRGVTMVEVLTAVGLVVVLMTLLVISARAVRASSRKSQAEAQLHLIASAIERYAAAWPKWIEVGTTMSGPATVRGLPHWSGRWVFDSTTLLPNNRPFLAIPGFNDMAARRRDLSDDDAVDAAGRFTGRDDVQMSSDVLAYQLTATAMGGPFLVDKQGLFSPDISGQMYPTHAAAEPSRPRLHLVDPWGHPYRYLWVTRDAASQAGWRAVTSADPDDGGDPASDPFTVVNHPYCQPADGFVIESAGPDGRFGNLWIRNPSAQQIEDARDNLSVRP